MVAALSLMCSQAAYPANAGFVTTQDTRLRLNGHDFFATGANQYHFFYQPQTMVDEVLQDARDLGLNVIRTWASCEGAKQNGYCFQPQPRVYDEPTFRKLDYALYRANQLNLRVVLPLVNNWSDFGGMSQYLAWCGSTAGHDDFYRNPCAKALYQDYVRYVLTRVNTYTGVQYRHDPTIFMWELANEPRCASDPTGDTLVGWVRDMSSFIKSLDPNHLVATGEEGWYTTKGADWRRNGSNGADFVRNSQVESIDIASFRLYPQTYLLDEAAAIAWIDEHVDDAHRTVGKPVFLGEFGWRARRKIYGDFSTGTETWRASWGYRAPERVASPSWNGNGSLRFPLAASLPAWGSAGGEKAFAAPGLDLRSYGMLTGWVHVPSTAPAGMKAALYLKSGPGWNWLQGPVTPLARGGWTQLTMSTTQNTDVRAVGIKLFNGPTPYAGPAYYDTVVSFTPAAGSTVADRNRAFGNWYNRMAAIGANAASFWILSGHQENTSFAPDYDGYSVYAPEDTETSRVIQTYSTTVAGNNTPTDDAPFASIESPSRGGTVAGAVTVKARVTDDQGVSSVAYAVDDGPRRAMVLAFGVWQATWDSLSVSNGTHAITVFANDTGGHTGQARVEVTVRN